MNKIKKIRTLIIFIIICGVFSCYTVYADPNSSKGFAEYDDVKAEEENKKILEEQEKEQEAMVGKSNDNYLKSLEVEGYKISPEFDKQTIDYVINETLKSDEINIIATPSNEKAKIEGAGKIKLEENQKQCRIDVTAESGTVRTYMIYLGEQAKEEYKDTSEEDQNMQIEETGTVPEISNENTVSNNFIMIIILGIIIIIGMIFYAVRKSKNKTKRKH